MLADIFHESLVERRLISPEVEALADIAEVDERAMGPLQDAFDAAYARDADGFCEALTDASDIAGTLLAETLWHLEADYLDYGAVARVMLAVDAAETGGRYGADHRAEFPPPADRRTACRAADRETQAGRAAVAQPDPAGRGKTAAHELSREDAAGADGVKHDWYLRRENWQNYLASMKPYLAHRRSICSDAFSAT